ALIGFALEDLVQSAGVLGKDLDDQIRRALDVLFRDDRRPLVGDEQEIGLKDVVGREDNVRWGDEEPPESMLADEFTEMKRQADDEVLMPDERRGGHEMLPADDLVTLAVLRDEDVILVGELGVRLVESHTVASSGKFMVTRALRPAR